MRAPPDSVLRVRGRIRRSYPAVVARFWRTSLQFRTVAITILLSSIAVSLIGAYMSISIGDNLFSSRRDQVSQESSRATVLAQEIFDAALASDDNNPVDLETLSSDAVNKILPSVTQPGDDRHRHPAQARPGDLAGHAADREREFPGRDHPEPAQPG